MADFIVSVNQGTANRIYISNVSPPTGRGGDEITIKGGNFYGVDTVKFNDVAANYNVISQSHIVAAVPNSATLGSISVGSSSRGTTGVFSTYDFVPFPRITSFSPITGTSGTAITIAGNNFSGATGVLANNISLDSFVVTSNTQITGSIPDGNTRGLIKVLGPSGVSDESEDTFLLQPIVTSTLPASGQIGSAVQVSGINFYSTTLSETSDGSSLYFLGFGTSEATGGFTLQDANTLTGLVPENSISGSVFVYTPENIEDSNVKFHVLHSAPTITNVTPGSGTSGDLISVVGTNIYDINSMTVSGHSDDATTPITSFTYDTGNGEFLNFSLPNLTVQSYAVILSGLAGNAGYDNAIYILSNPSLSGFSPLSGKEGDVVSISGENFYQQSKVFVNTTGTQATISSIANNSISFLMPFVTQTGNYFIVDNGVSGVTGSVFRGFLKPVISGFEALSGSFNDTILISGAGFDTISTVKIGSTTISSSNYTVTNFTGIDVTLPSFVTDGLIFIEGSGGNVESTGVFDFLTPPITFSGFEPITGYPGLTELTLTGLRMDNVVEIQFSGASSTISLFDFIISGGYQITATIPSNVVTNKISVVDLEDRITQSSDTLTINTINVPSITGFGPTEGPTGSFIHISGTGMGSVNSLTINGTAADFSIVTIDSQNVVSGTIPAIHPFPQSVDFTVSSAAGSSTSGDFLIYAHDVHVYDTFTIINSGLTFPNNGVKYYSEMLNNTTGHVKYDDPNGTGIILSTFII